MYITRVRLKNIRCFADLDIRFDLNGDTIPLTLLLGDNATGKTTLLRSLAMGLCDESSAAGLMKEAEVGYIRKGEKSGKIVIDLKRGVRGRKTFCITTNLSKMGTVERLRQRTTPKEKFPWKEIFACGYGAGRGVSGAGDIPDYTVINAVYNLFNYSEGLQNPELTILRIVEDSKKESIINALNTLLQTGNIELKKSGLFVEGPWGSMPLRDLADGYKSSFLWLTDFLGWALSRDQSLSDVKDIRGIILLDEIEQHLHPKWQQEVVARMRISFPRIQFIMTTHSPVIVASAGQVQESKDRDNLILLKLSPGNLVSARPLPSMPGRRADQVLASAAFDYVTTSDREINAVLREASRLSGKGISRTSAEEQRYQILRKEISDHLISEEETPIEREIMNDLDARMRGRIIDLQRRLFGDSNDKNTKS